MVTRTTKTKTSGRAGSGKEDSISHTPRISLESLQKEAEDFLASRGGRALDAKTYLVGCALTGLLARSPGMNEQYKEQIKREAIQWAEEMLRELG